MDEQTSWKMLRVLLILTTTILITNGLPFTDSTGTYHGEIQLPEAQQTDQQSTDQEYQEYLGIGDQNLPTFAQQEESFTISCTGENHVCLDKHQCANGYIYTTGNEFIVPLGQDQQCRIDKEVCCKIIVEFPKSTLEAQEVESDLGGDDSQKLTIHKNPPFQTPDQSATINQAIPGQGVDQIPDFEQQGSSGIQVPSKTEQIPFPSKTDEIPVKVPKPITPFTDFPSTSSAIQTECAAALICVEDKFCTMDGTISQEPVILRSEQLLWRVPLSTCKNRETGIIGKCCRDPNYVDPWPTGNLPANYSGGFDEKGFPTFLNIAKVKVPKKPVQVAPKPKLQLEKFIPPQENINSPSNEQNLIIPAEIFASSNQIATSVNSLQSPDENNVVQRCGIKNKMPRRPGMEESETVFAEIPWQAMVLHTKEKKILCSGALINTDSVLTAANCVDNLSPDEVSIKVGEWKLGYELKEEEPLPFEILNVSTIKMHPDYTRGFSGHDLALLHLEEPATLDLHVNPLCLPETENIAQESRHCITTGWGKEILQAHYAGAIMHAVGVNVLPTDGCKNHLITTEFNPEIAESAICAKTAKERNNVCESDLGGPLACENERGFYELAGIYSQDTGCQSVNQVAVFAPVDDQWIERTLTAPKFSDDFQNTKSTNNYRDSVLSTDNQYLPPK